MNTIPSRPLQILVVEDSESDFELLTYRIRSGDIQANCIRVDDAKGLETQLNLQSWDMVISDHRLPGFSSEEALNLVREHQPGVPFIIVSGKIGEDVAVEAMRSGADDYLMKDNLKRLVPAIERSLRSAQERRERLLAELAKRESEARLAATASNLPGVIFQMISSIDGDHVETPLVSDGALKLFGKPSRVFLDDPQYFLKQFNADDAVELKSLLQEPKSHQRTVTWEGRLALQSDDNPHWTFMSLRCRGQSSQKVIWDGILIDITAQKTAEQQLRESQAELRRITTEFEKRREEERGSIAREIHDDIGGTLTKLKADISWLKKRYGEDQDSYERFEDMLELIEHTVMASQRIAKDLRPGILDYGLIPALEWQMKDFSKRNSIVGLFKCNTEELSLDPECSTAIFRVLQEGLTNIVKHAQANRVEVELFVDDDDITLEIRDDGVGIKNSDKDKKQSFGVRGMIERISTLGGWLDINGSPGKGTTLMLSVPR